MQLNTSGIAAPQCGNYDDALVAAKTRAALGCCDPRMTPKFTNPYCPQYSLAECPVFGGNYR